MASPIRIIVAEDESGYRNALQRVFKLATDIEVVSLCKDGQEAFDALRADAPDVLVTDIEMPRMNGVELIRRAMKVEKDLRIVVLTSHDEDDVVYDAFRAGALGYLLKTSSGNDVLDAVRLAAKGEAKITPKIAAKLLEDFRRFKEDDDIDDTELYELSDRESEILDLVAQGMRNKEIATRLGIAEKTVKNHVSNILKALQVNSRTEAAMKAVKSRLVERP
jgi:DNA-binding NarL/FixJ family response regulator